MPDAAFVNDFTNFLQSKLNNKAFDHYRDETRSIWSGTDGQEYFANGNTQNAEIHVLDDGRADITVHFNWSYVRKKYRGIGNEYTREERSGDNGLYKFQYTLGRFSAPVVSEISRSAFESNGAGLDINHDSCLTAFQGLIEDLIVTLRTP